MSLVFTENRHLVEFSPVMKVSFVPCVKSGQIQSFFQSVFKLSAGKYAPKKTPYLATDNFHTVQHTKREVKFTAEILNGKHHYLCREKRKLLHIVNHSFSICCDFKANHFEIDHLKSILRKSNHPQNFIDSCIKSFVNKSHTPKVSAQNVPNRIVFVKGTLMQILKSANIFIFI